MLASCQECSFFLFSSHFQHNGTCYSILNITEWVLNPFYLLPLKICLLFDAKQLKQPLILPKEKEVHQLVKQTPKNDLVKLSFEPGSPGRHLHTLPLDHGNPLSAYLFCFIHLVSIWLLQFKPNNLIVSITLWVIVLNYSFGFI